MLDNKLFLETALRLGVLNNMQASRIAQEVKAAKGRKTAIEAAKAAGMLSDVQVGTVLSAMYSRASEDAGVETIEGEHCLNHPGRLATRSCNRCGNPLCPDCGWAEDGFIFCGEDCLETYRAERDEVEADQTAQARRRAALKVALIAGGLLVVLVVGLIVWMVVGAHLRQKKAQDLFQQALVAKGLQKVELIKQTLQHNPKIQDAREHLPAGYLEAGQFEDAEKAARDILAKSPDNTHVKKVLAKALLGQKRLAEAIAIFNELAGSMSTEEVRALGISLYRDLNAMDEAVPWLEKAHGSVKEDRELALLLGRYYRQKGDREKALGFLDKAADYNVVAGDQRERDYVKKPGVVSGAIRELSELAAEKEDYKLLSTMLTRLKQGLNTNAANAADLVAVLELMAPIASDTDVHTLIIEAAKIAKSGSVAGLNRLNGLLAARQGKLDDAAVYLEKALQEKADDTAAREYLVSLYLDQADYRRARLHFETLRASGQSGFQMKLWEARLLNGEGKATEALSLAEEILAERADVPQALVISSELLLAQGDFLKAWRRLDSLCSLKPGPRAFLKAFLAAWRIGALESAGAYSARLSGVLSGLPNDYQETLKRLLSVFSGESDPSSFNDQTLTSHLANVSAPAIRAQDVFHKLYIAACMYSYSTAVLSQVDGASLNQEMQKFSLPGGLGTGNAYDVRGQMLIAERFKEGSARLLRQLVPYTGNLRSNYERVADEMSKNYSLAPSAPEKIAAAARSLRDAGYLIYRAQATGQQKGDEAFRLVTERHARLASAWSGRDLAVVMTQQALEALCLAATSLPDGFIVEASMAQILNDCQEKVRSAEDALTQLRWQFVQLARVVWAVQFLRQLAIVDGALGRRVR